jgi:hypothetical protein
MSHLFRTQVLTAVLRAGGDGQLHFCAISEVLREVVCLDCLDTHPTGCARRGLVSRQPVSPEAALRAWGGGTTCCEVAGRGHCRGGGETIKIGIGPQPVCLSTPGCNVYVGFVRFEINPKTAARVHLPQHMSCKHTVGTALVLTM